MRRKCAAAAQAVRRAVTVQGNLDALGRERLIAHKGPLVENLIPVVAPVEPAVDSFQLCPGDLLEITVQFKHTAFDPCAGIIAAVAPLRRQLLHLVFRRPAAPRLGVRPVMAALRAAVYARKRKPAHVLPPNKKERPLY